MVAKDGNTTAAASKLNVHNRSIELYNRFRYFADAAQAKSAEAEARKGETIKTEYPGGYSLHFPAYALMREASWLRLAAIEHFFSWTEHIFIHIAILMGKAITGNDVASLAKAEWADKYKAAIGLTNTTSKKFYDDLLALRRQVRNFVAHGSFGKDGEAFQFHSGAGAVPLRLLNNPGKAHFAFGAGLDFNDKAALELIERSIEHVWADERTPAKIYIQQSGLPLILTYAQNGKYNRAMQSASDMESFTEGLMHEFDRASNMDF